MAVEANSSLWYHIMKLKYDLATLKINLSSLFMNKVRNGNDTSFWHDKWMGEDTLCVPFPPLYRLESNKCGFVSDRCPTARGSNIVSLIVDSKPLGLDNHHGLNFQWAWCINEMRNLITSLHTLVPSSPMRWNKIASAMININSWRVLNKWMPTHMNLDCRGIDLASIRCPMCDENVETKGSCLCLLQDCVTDTWKEFIKWRKIPHDSSFDLHDMIHMADNTIISQKLIKFLDVVVQTTIWTIWKSRNNMVFSKKMLEQEQLALKYKAQQESHGHSRLDSNVRKNSKNFYYILKIDPDLLTKDIEGFKTYDEYKDDWIYEWNVKNTINL
ncbi:RNA-directed DNA polymerase, eukaryota, reverse transcriptase zinc-binding domain protein [Tanacetum coccineum]